jgi:hypothetical protein
LNKSQTRSRRTGLAALLARTALDIEAPINLVWSVMIDLKAYREWNTFIVDVDPRPDRIQIGSRFQLHVRWANGGSARSWETVTRLDSPASSPGAAPAARLVYDYSGWLAQAGLVRARREQCLSQPPGRPTLYQTEEIFGGLLARFVPLRDVQEGFERQARALKRRAESLSGSRDSHARKA